MGRWPLEVLRSPAGPFGEPEAPRGPPPKHLTALAPPQMALRRSRSGHPRCGVAPLGLRCMHLLETSPSDL
ncbi:hypothetical protein GW17_00049313 [Ensete ventricosum]|nr:hypothetical protein GW17_00049313 [Ensete ventricosum]